MWLGWGKELSIQALLFGFWMFALTSRLLPTAAVDNWTPKSGDIMLLIAGLCAYTAGAIALRRS